MEGESDQATKEAKSDRDNNTDNGESWQRDEQAYQTGLVQNTDLPDRQGVEISRVQATAVHFEFADPVMDIVMISVVDALRLLKRGETAETVFGDALVIVTTTVPDHVLERWYPQKEIRLVKDFQPDFYIPCDRPVYRKDTKAERRDKITRYLRDLKEIANAIESAPTEIIPLVKGILPRERARCYQCFEELDFDRIGYYCAQYFLYGNRGKELIRDVRQIAQEAQPTGMLLVGLQARSYLRKMPPEVIAVAGQRWISESGLRDADYSMRDAQRQYLDWSTQVERDLAGGQTRLRMFNRIKTTGEIYGN